MTARPPSPRAPVSDRWAVTLGAVIGAAFFLWIAGLRIVTPTDTSWVMRFDWATHYFGWKFFRLEPWHWPPGAVHGYNAPLGTAIGLTDALPLAAYLLKPFSAWLPEDVQYLGPWELLCFTLQGALAARLFGRWTPHLLPRLAAATLFVLAPILLARTAHAALCAHWLLLWCFLLATRDPAAIHRPREWAALGLLAGMIQPYLAAMVAVLLGAIAVNRAPTPWLIRGRALGSAAAAMLLGWWLSGMFTLGGPAGLSAGGLGMFSANLLGPISPYGISRLLPEWPAMGEGQLLEGNHYFGAGALLLIALAGISGVVMRLRGGNRLPPVVPIAITAACVVLGVVALSPRVTLGTHVVVDYSSPWVAPLALFRSTGRFLWPLDYLVLMAAIVAVLRRTTPVTATAVLGLTIGVQLYDLHDYHGRLRAASKNPAFYTWDNPFVSPAWDRIGPQFEHLVLAPPPQCAASALPTEPALWFGARHRLTVNTGTLSRGNDVARARYCERLAEDVRNGHLDGTTLYVVLPAEAERIRSAPGDNRCGQIDDVTICTTLAQYPVWQRYVKAPAE